MLTRAESVEPNSNFNCRDGFSMKPSHGGIQETWCKDCGYTFQEGDCLFGPPQPDTPLRLRDLPKYSFCVKCGRRKVTSIHPQCRDCAHYQQNKIIYPKPKPEVVVERAPPSEESRRIVLRLTRRRPLRDTRT